MLRTTESMLNNLTIFFWALRNAKKMLTRRERRKEKKRDTSLKLQMEIH